MAGERDATGVKPKGREMDSLQFRVLLIPHGDSWTAQCLEYDLATQGKTLSETQKYFELLISDQIAVDKQFGRKPFAGLPKAPKMYWDAWTRARELAAKRAPRRQSKSSYSFIHSVERVADSAVA